MSLRVRLILSIILVLVLSLCVGGAVAGWHAVRSVRAEMQAALEVAAQTLRDRLADLPEPWEPDAPRRPGQAPVSGLANGHAHDNTAPRPLEFAMVHSFDGDRHVKAVLLDRAGRERAASAVHMPGFSMPDWFVAFLTPTLVPLRFDVDANETIILEPDPRNEIGEVWVQFKDDLTAIGLFCVLGVTLTSLIVQHALRPLERVAAALVALGAGDCTVRVRPQGPRELIRLAHGINTMAGQLQAAQARNLRLTEQLLTLQEEERADLARDLHDEIGPMLFAVHLDAAAIGQAAAAHAPERVSERAQAIRDAVSHMQRHVRAMLNRLRPPNPVEAGLGAALGNLLTFWRTRCPNVVFGLTIAGDEDALETPSIATIYRLAQESLNNAVRHGRPTRIDIAVTISPAGEAQVRIADNGGGRISSEPGLGLNGLVPSGLGLTGMRERVEALGGLLCAGDDPQGQGFIVTASLPRAAALEDA